jgi:hypothetical protein
LKGAKKMDEIAQALYEAIEALANRWGAPLMIEGCKEIREAGVRISFQSVRYGHMARIAADQPWSQDIAIEKYDGKFYVHSGNPEHGIILAEKLAQHMASQDFIAKKEKSVRRLKAITKAIAD